MELGWLRLQANGYTQNTKRRNSMFLFLLGLFCFLLTIGYFTRMGALAFALISMVALIAGCFVLFLFACLVF